MNKITLMLGVIGGGLCAYAMGISSEAGADLGSLPVQLSILFAVVFMLKVLEERESGAVVQAQAKVSEGEAFSGAKVSLYDSQARRVVNGTFDAVLMFRRVGEAMDTLSAIDEERLGDDTSRVVQALQEFVVRNAESLEKGDLGFLERLNVAPTRVS